MQRTRQHKWAIILTVVLVGMAFAALEAAPAFGQTNTNKHCKPKGHYGKKPKKCKKHGAVLGQRGQRGAQGAVGAAAAAPSPLPFTGAQIAGFVVAALVLIALGTMLVLRRRRTTSG